MALQHSASAVQATLSSRQPLAGSPQSPSDAQRSLQHSASLLQGSSSTVQTTGSAGPETPTLQAPASSPEPNARNGRTNESLCMPSSSGSKRDEGRRRKGRAP